MMGKETFVVVRSRNVTKIRHMSLREDGRGQTPPEPLEVSTTTLDARGRRDVLRDPNVVGAAPAIPLRLVQPRSRKPTASSAGSPWGLTAIGLTGKPAFEGSGISVAVLDTGIDVDHPAFAHLKDRIVRRDFTGGATTDDAGSAPDEHGHGTHCAGTLFGGTVMGTRIGVAPGIAKALIGKVIGPGGSSTSVLTEAIEWAVREGAQIVSMSLGIDFPGLVRTYEQVGYPPDLAASKALVGYRANIEMFGAMVAYLTRSAAGRGEVLLFVAAAGNESHRDKRADHSIVLSPPAAAEGFVSVGALELDGGETKYRVAPYSNVGVRVCAPGSAIVSAVPGGDLEAMSGTSMAAPHVAGVAALWAEKLKLERGRYGTRYLLKELEGRATLEDISPEAAPEEVGFGLVKAPPGEALLERPRRQLPRPERQRRRDPRGVCQVRGACGRARAPWGDRAGRSRGGHAPDPSGPLGAQRWTRSRRARGATSEARDRAPRFRPAIGLCSNKRR